MLEYLGSLISATNMQLSGLVSSAAISIGAGFEYFGWLYTLLIRTPHVVRGTGDDLFFTDTYCQYQYLLESQ